MVSNSLDKSLQASAFQHIHCSVMRCAKTLLTSLFTKALPLIEYIVCTGKEPEHQDACTPKYAKLCMYELSISKYYH